MHHYIQNKPIKWGFTFWFCCSFKSEYLYQFDMYLGKKPKTEFGLGKSVVDSLCENLTFFTSPNLILKLFEDGIYATGTVRSNQKQMPTLKADQQMKRGEHDWLACDTISATKWMDNWSVILLSNCHNPDVVQEINRRVKGSKERVKVSCPAVIREYNMYIGVVDLHDQVKVSYEVDRRSKVRFYLRLFSDFLDISIVISKIVYDKIQSTAAMSSMDFRFSLACSMIGTFSNRKRAIPASQYFKRSKSEITMVVDHLPEFAATHSRCGYCSLIKLENPTFIRCMKCHIPLCLQKETNCFYEHHIQQ